MNIDSVLKLIEEEFTDIPDFLLVANRVPLSGNHQARLDAMKLTQPPTPEEKWQRNRRLYEAEGERQKLLAAEKAKPAAQVYFAKKAAAAAEIKAVKQAAKAAHRGAIK